MNFLDQLVMQALADFNSAVDNAALENAKAKYLGKASQINKQMKNLGGLAPNDRSTQGAFIHNAKKKIELNLKMRRHALNDMHMQQRLDEKKIDLTLPGRGRGVGGIHPLTRSWQRIEEIFRTVGFDVAEGPEIETDWINFTALNSPENHPARSMQDTFYVDTKDNEGKQLLLRTHTSSMQVRYALINKPPIKVIVPGRTYRVDSDATHSPMFHQVEGLWIDENLSFANLKGIYLAFVNAFFETDDLKIRFRPSYFPFTTPSAEVDVAFNTGPLKGRWLEVSGAGQVHPKVVCNMGLDPEQFTGFAFGSGIERLTMLRYGIDDLRLFYEGDMRFLKQFN